MMEPVAEAPVIIEKAAAGPSSGMLMPLLLLAVVVAVVSYTPICINFSVYTQFKMGR